MPSDRVYPLPRDAVDNAWRHYFAGLLRQVGGTSLLPVLPLDEEELFTTVTIAIKGAPPRNRHQARRARSNGKSAPPVNRGETGEGNRGEAAEPLPLYDGGRDVRDDGYEPYGVEGSWRRKLSGSIRNHNVNLADLLPRLNDYFASFRYLKRCDSRAYGYFSRVGLPVGSFDQSLWKTELDEPPLIADPTSLPTFFGSFNPVPEPKERKIFAEDGTQLPHVTYMFRVKYGRSVAAPPDMVVYEVVEWYTRRPWAERGIAKKNIGIYWYLGIGPDGFCRALPFRWFSGYRTNAEKTYTEAHFGIPEGVREMAENAAKNGPLAGPSNRPLVDRWAHCWFSAVRALSMGALDGVEVSFRRNGMTARVGVPLQQVAEFFRNRDLVEEGGRRRKIFHTVAPHDRHLADGRTVAVGEQFRGIRRFSWNGYEVLISIPGVHHPAVEGLSADGYEEEVFGKRDGYDGPQLGRMMAHRVWRDNQVRMRRGQPTKSYVENPFFADKAVRARDQLPYPEHR